MAGLWYETEDGLAWLAQCRADVDAEVAFIASHTREEVAERIFAARRDKRWKRWWEPKPSAPVKWNPPYPVRRDVAVRYGAAPQAVTRVMCRCGATGSASWKGRTIRFVGLHLDHIKPRSRGGADTAENLQILCPSCNFRKGARWEG